jgi:hypothetical protein
MISVLRMCKQLRQNEFCVRVTQRLTKPVSKYR